LRVGYGLLFTGYCYKTLAPPVYNTFFKFKLGTVLPVPVLLLGPPAAAPFLLSTVLDLGFDLKLVSKSSELEPSALTLSYSDLFLVLLLYVGAGLADPAFSLWGLNEPFTLVLLGVFVLFLFDFPE